MAKDTAVAAPVSEESVRFLEEVKKGKPRKFAMICKGASLVSLVVYKKGNVEKYKKEAKKSGKGQFYFGIVDGKGVDIRFALARADGFEKPPVKTLTLKSFLADSADLKFKPYFEIVDEPQLVLDEDDPLVARFLRWQEAALRACEAHPDRAAEINSLCRQIGSHLDQDQPDPATEKLDQLETLLGGLGEGAPAAPSAPTTPDGQKLSKALTALTPLVQKALSADPTRKSEILAPAASIKELLSQGQLVEAREQLLAYGEFLKGLVAAAPQGSGGGVSLVALGKARLEWVQVRDTAVQDIRRLKDAIQVEFKDDREQASQLTSALAMLDEKVDRLDDRLHEELDAVLNAEDSAREPLIRAARSTLGDLLAFLATDPVMAEIDDNEVIAGMRVRAPLEAQLDAISTALG
jgi:hypothetical protein